MWTSAVQLPVPARSSIESLCIRRDRREQVIVILTDRTKMWETDWRMERQNKVGAGGGSVARITSAALRLKSRQLHGRVRGWFSRDVKKKTRVVRRRSPERENVLYQIVTCKSSLLSEKSAKHTVILMDSSLNTNRFVHWQTAVHGDHTFTLKRWKMADVWTDRTCDDSFHPGVPKWQRDSQKSGVITDDKLWDVDSLWLLLASPGVARSSDLCWEFTAKKTRLNSRGRSCLSMQSAEASADHNHVRNSHQNVLKCVVLFNQQSKSQSYSASCYIKLRNTVNLHPWGAGTRYQIVCFAIKRLIVSVLLGLQARAQDRPT